MARLESQAKAGYYPTPDDLLGPISSLVALPEGYRVRILFDPCAGDGAAILDLKNQWGIEAEVYACEMEAARFDSLQSRLRYNHAFHGDAFQLDWKRQGQWPDKGGDVLFLNPPYDHDPVHGRTEQRFLDRFTQALAPGGALIFVVPFHALKTSAAHLARHFTDISCFRFPGEHFETFKQVVLVARRIETQIPEPGAEAKILRWSKSPELLPELGAEFEPVRVECSDRSFTPKMQELDLQAVLANHSPCRAMGTGADSDLGELMGKTWPVAMTPKPAHIAIALMAGVFNGQELRPSRAGLPKILAKGTTARQLVEVSKKLDKEGAVKASVQVEQPRLNVTILDTKAGQFHRLRSDHQPSHSADLSQWTIGDLLEGYSEALIRLMDEQFPALYDVRRGNAVVLPPLARSPFVAQNHAIQAALMLLGRGECPMVMMETGTGKSQVALSIREAMSPANHAATVAQLQSKGVPAAFGPARRTLIACPPHLMTGWINEIEAVTPWVRIVEVECISDLHKDGDIYLVSRETLKLGHGFRGIERRCPKCGGPVPESAEVNARRRQRCQAQTFTSSDIWARRASRLALALLPYMPGDGHVQAVLASSRTFRRRATRPKGAADWQAITTIGVEVFRDLEKEALQRNSNYQTLTDLGGLVALFARGLGRESLGARVLKRLGKMMTGASRGAYGPSWQASTVIEQGLGLAENPTISRDKALAEALKAMSTQGEWRHSKPCGEPLFQAEGTPRFPLARYIVRYMPRRFDLIVLDEIHEAGNKGTAQSHALHRLARLGVPTIAMSGTMMGGYTSSLFGNLHALSRGFREEFGRDDQPAFLKRFGSEVVEVSKKAGVDQPVDFGSRSDRRKHCNTRRVKEAPDIMPSAILAHILPTGIILHIDDLEDALPARTEHLVALAPETDHDRRILAEYRRILNITRQQMASDRFRSGYAGKLGGALAQMESYLDRSALSEFRIGYPDGETVAVGAQMEAEELTVKERWLLDTLEAETSEGRRVMVFVRHTGVGLAARLRDLVESAGLKVAFLDAKKVSARKRQAWIDAQVHRKGVQVLIVNPVAVATGLNNLAKCDVPGLPGFATGIWYQQSYDARVVRQAGDGRLRRIGQTQEVRIYHPVWAGTTQSIGADLVSRKVEASRRVDALSVGEALGGDESGAVAALAIGEAIARRLDEAEARA